jgi:hypothetical protein
MLTNFNNLVHKIWSVSLEPYWGTLGQIKLHLQDQKQQPSLETAINKFQERWPDFKSSDRSSPIFIFSAGWRSGSTLLQRLIMSSKEVMIWGEPYSHNNLIESLSSPLKGITDTYPRESWFLSRDRSEDLTQFFTANLYPDMRYLLEAHLAFLNNLFALPAREIGFSRWGFKEVRLDIESAIYLKWLFPQAKFIFLYRNPYDAYASFAGSYWYKKWPKQPVYTPKHFGKNWTQLMQGYLDKYQQVQGKLISYENLCSSNFDFEALADFLELPIDKNVMQFKVTGNIKKQKNNDYYNKKHLKVLQKYVEPLAIDLGYQPLNSY